MRSWFRRDQDQSRVTSSSPEWPGKETDRVAQYERMIPQAYPLFAQREGTIATVIGWLPYRDEEEPDEIEEGSYLPVLVGISGFGDGLPWEANLVESQRISYYITEKEAQTAAEDYFKMVAEDADRLQRRKPPTKGPM